MVVMLRGCRWEKEVGNADTETELITRLSTPTVS